MDQWEKIKERNNVQYAYLRNMTDVHTKEQRRKNMQAIKGKNTKPEILVRKFLHQHGFRLHDKKLPGKLDIILPKYKTVIFVAILETLLLNS